MKRGVLQIVLAALLLLAQHTALTHQVQHLRDGLPAPSKQGDTGKQKSQSDTCCFHVAFAELLGSVNSAALPLQIVVNAVERSANLFSRAFPADLVVPASRGPPNLS